MAGKRTSKISTAKEPAGETKGRRFATHRLPFLASAVVVVYLLFSLSGQFLKLTKMESEVRGMQQQVQSLQSRNDELQNELKQIQSDAYIEQVAREKLGLVKPGEYPVVSVPQGGNTSN